jgi:hypothetical protein
LIDNRVYLPTNPAKQSLKVHSALLKRDPSRCFTGAATLTVKLGFNRMSSIIIGAGVI